MSADFPVPQQAQALDDSVVLLNSAAQELTISTQSEAEHATDLLARIQTKLRQAEEGRKALVKPLNDHVKFINGTFKERTGPLEQAKATVAAAMTTYVRQREAEAAERRRQAEREAQEERDRLAKQAERARVAAMLDEEPDQAPPPPPEVVPAYVAPPAKVRADTGAQVVARKTWKFRVDLDEMVRVAADDDAGEAQVRAMAMLAVDERRVREAMRHRMAEIKAGGQPQPGVHFYEETDAHVR